MSIGRRIIPEIRPTVIKLSTRYYKAKELDLCKEMRVAQYKETHQLIYAAKSLRMVCSAVASSTKHVDEKVTVIDPFDVC